MVEKVKRRAAIAGLLGTMVALKSRPPRAQSRESAPVDNVIGELRMHRAQHEDIFPDIARRNGLGYIEMLAANPGVDPWLPGEGTGIVLPTAWILPDAPRRKGFVVNLPEMRLYWYREDDTIPESFPIGIGREGRTTPIGTTRIARKQEKPTWTPPPSIRAEHPELPAVVGPGPDNPLGDYAFYLAWDRYLIHGTNQPGGIGRRSSSGCLRMYPEDVQRLFENVEVGTRVTVVHQEVKFGWRGGDLYMEIHPTLEQADELVFEHEFVRVTIDEIVDMAIQAAGDQAGRVDLLSVMRAERERRGYPVRILRGPDTPATATL